MKNYTKFLGIAALSTVFFLTTNSFGSSLNNVEQNSLMMENEAGTVECLATSDSSCTYTIVMKEGGTLKGESKGPMRQTF